MHGPHPMYHPEPPRARPPGSMSPLAKKLVLALALTMVLGAIATVGGIVGVFWWFSRDVADLDEAKLRNYRPPQITRIVDRDGVLIGEIYTQRRTVVAYEQIPSHVENAFLAAEDADFYKHEGMDVLGMVRALFVNIKAGEVRQGASTITQQVVKIFLLTPERTFDRKVQELVLARRLEQALGKTEILELYLNEIYLGHGRYGIEEASWFYFGKSVKDIDLGQAALLATLPKAPSRDSPLKNPDKAQARQHWVLNQMVEHGLAKPDDVAPFLAAKALPLAQDAQRPTPQPGAEEFVDEIKTMLEAQYGADALPYLGATVHATVSLPVQRAARAGLVAGLVELDTRQHYGRGLKPAKAKQRAQVAAQGDRPLPVGEVVTATIEERPAGVTLPVDGFAASVGEHRLFVAVPVGSRYDDPELDAASQFPTGAVVRVAIAPRGEEDGLPKGWLAAELDEGPEGAVVVADVETGELLAMVGGVEHELGDFNRAAHALRQPGSAFKPFVYGAALNSRQYTAATLVSDSPEIYEKWRPTNFEADVYRGDIRLREALTQSVNTIAIKLLDKLGTETVHAFARAAGITRPLPEDLSLALGTGEVTPLELLSGYLTLARGGSRLDPAMIRSIELQDGTVVTPERVATEAFGADVAYVLASMMQSVVQSGTGTKAKALGRPVAGKTGTSAEHHDAWFAGFTPKTVAVAWVGFDRPRPLGKSETGGRAAIPIWLAAMQAAETGPPASFQPPATVTVRRIDAVSGLLAPPDAEDLKTLDEVFLAGTEPVDEAVPAALPAGDVLLDLYGDGGDGQVPADEGGDAPVEPPPSDPPPVERKPVEPRLPGRGGARELPSLED
jgi:penicillin-binding protein 1A